MRREIFVLAVVFGALCCTDRAFGQAMPRIGGNNSRSFVQKYITSRPTVSPYLNLVRDQSQSFGAPNYQTLVRPALEQRELARAQERQVANLQQQIGTMQGDIRRAQSGVISTGHPTRFMTYLHFYPTLNR